MIKISKLRLKNFKSFKKAELQFSNGFTAVVGSNGSGKSNIFDALLFVLGISSMKALRAGKMIDLINHNADTDYATVEIELKDNQKKFELSRSIDKQGKATVRLDGKKIGLNEAQSLLEELDVKATGHNIVVQGDITRIIEMNDIQRREVIDDMAGLREFDEKKAEALKELEKVDTKIKEVRIVLSERESYLEELSKEKNAAMEFNALTEELKKSKATLLKEEIEKINSGLKENQEKTKKATETRAEKEAKLAEAKKELEELEKEIEELNKKIIATKEKAFSGAAIEAEEKKAEKKVKEEREQSKLAAIEKNSRRIDELGKRNIELENQKQSKTREISEKEAELKELEKEISQLNHSYEETTAKIKEKDYEIDLVEKELAQLNKELDGAKEDYFSKKSEQQARKENLDNAKKTLFDLEKENNELAEKINQMQKKQDALKAIKAKHANADKELLKTEKEIETVTERASYCASAIDSLNESIEKLSKAIANCPTCESKLSAEKKKGLLEKKQSDLKQLKAEQKALKDSVEQKKETKAVLEKAIDEMNILAIELRGFEELKQRKTVCEQKILETKNKQSKASFEIAEKEIALLQEKIDSLEQRAREKEKTIMEKRQKTSLAAVQEINDKTNKLLQKRNEAKGKKKELELELNKLIAEEQAANSQQIESLRTENIELEKIIAIEKKEIAAIELKVRELEIEVAKAEKASKGIEEEKEKKQQKTVSTKEKISKAESMLRDIERQLNEINIENSKLEVRLNDLQQEFSGFVEVQTIKDFDITQLRKRIPEIERRIKELGAINLKAVESFGSYEQELLEIKKKSDKLEQERLAVLEMINKIEVRRTEVFLDCFNAINRNFNKLFFELADGEGKLTLSNMEKPLESGMIIEASFKGKGIKNIDLMSGGEKTLTALAFLFALQLYEPAPFYLFDEADAALDKENSVKFSKIIKNISKTSQFIAITHNDTVIKEANQIVGVALNKEKSSVIGLKLKEELENTGNNGSLTQTIN